MKRAGFTMIELIFVIVILGILAAVAIPKMQGVKDDALLANANENFCINVKSSLVNRALRTDTLKGLDMANYINLPSGFEWTDSDVNGTLTTDKNIGDIDDAAGDIKPLAKNTTNNIYVFIIDGNSTTEPACAIGSSATSSRSAEEIRTRIATGKGNYI